MTTSRDQLHQNCLAIAYVLESNTENAISDFLDDALSIEYTVDGRKKFLGAEILVAFGGPTIWVNTQTDTIEGSWGDTTVNMRYYDAQDLHAYCQDLFDASSGH
ncbi:MAG: hypothetical protein AAGM84_11335 [Pseudomonadota bacterium]